MKKKFDFNELKNSVNNRHIEFYDKTLDILEFILKQYSSELKHADIEFFEMSKNSIATLDFLISSIGKVQKGQRLALGLDEMSSENSEPQINIIEGLIEGKI